MPRGEFNKGSKRYTQSLRTEVEKLKIKYFLSSRLSTEIGLKSDGININ